MSINQQLSAFERSTRLLAFHPTSSNVMATSKLMDAGYEACPDVAYAHPITYGDFENHASQCPSTSSTLGSAFDADELLQGGGAHNNLGLVRYGLLRNDVTQKSSINSANYLW